LSAIQPRSPPCLRHRQCRSYRALTTPSAQLTYPAIQRCPCFPGRATGSCNLAPSLHRAVRYRTCANQTSATSSYSPGPIDSAPRIARCNRDSETAVQTTRRAIPTSADVRAVRPDCRTLGTQPHWTLGRLVPEAIHTASRPRATLPTLVSLRKKARRLRRQTGRKESAPSNARRSHSRRRPTDRPLSPADLFLSVDDYNASISRANNHFSRLRTADPSRSGPNLGRQRPRTLSACNASSCHSFLMNLELYVPLDDIAGRSQTV
jgi:hypothetical protein